MFLPTFTIGAWLLGRIIHTKTTQQPPFARLPQTHPLLRYDAKNANLRPTSTTITAGTMSYYGSRSMGRYFQREASTALPQLLRKIMAPYLKAALSNLAILINDRHQSLACLSVIA